MNNDSNEIDVLLTRRKTGQFLSDRELVDLQPTNRDLGTVKGLDNLGQAIINRLITRQGELAALGHPNYGSRLHKLVGEQNNQRSQALAELYIRECLAQESRIAEVLEIIFANPKTVFERNNLKITINLKPVGTHTSSPLSIGLNLNL